MDAITQQEVHLLRTQLGHIHSAVSRIETAYKAHETHCAEERQRTHALNKYQNAAICVLIIFQILILGAEYLQIENLNISLF